MATKLFFLFIHWTNVLRKHGIPSLSQEGFLPPGSFMRQSASFPPLSRRPCRTICPAIQLILQGTWHCSDRQYSDRHCSDRHCSDKRYPWALYHKRHLHMCPFKWLLHMSSEYALTGSRFTRASTYDKPYIQWSYPSVYFLVFFRFYIF